MIKGVIFDVDGTLANSVELHAERRQPWHIINKVIQEGKLSLRFQINKFDVGLNQVISELSESQIQTAIISRAPSAYVSTMLSYLGVDFSFFRAGGRESPTQRLKNAIIEMNLQPSQVLYIADTSEDFMAANEVACKFEFAFWNGSDNASNSHWIQLLPKSSTLEYLYLQHFYSAAKVPERNLDHVVGRFYRDYLSIVDLEWLRESKYHFWKNLILPEIGETDKSFKLYSEEIASLVRSRGTSTDTIADMQSAIDNGDWASLLLYGRELIVAYKQRNVFGLEKKFRDIGKNLANPRGETVAEKYFPYSITGSVLTVLSEFGLVATPPQNLLMVQSEEVTARLRDFIRQNPLWLTNKSSLAAVNRKYDLVRVDSSVELKVPPTDTNSIIFHHNIFQGVSSSPYFLRQNYEFVPADLIRLFISTALPDAIECTELYPELSGMTKAQEIFTFFPYRQPNGLSGQRYWRWIKNWKYDKDGHLKSSEEIHLHYLELIALSIARFIWVRDPAAKLPIIAMPCSPIKQSQPAGASKRITHRVGQLLGRKPQYVLEKRDTEIVKVATTPMQTKRAFIIDDQITSGSTFKKAVTALGLSCTLVTWSSSRLPATSED